MAAAATRDCAQAARETGVVTVLVLISSVVWTNVLATFCDIVTNGDPVTTKFYQDLEQIANYMQERRIPNALQQRVREYMYHRACRWGPNQARIFCTRAPMSFDPCV